MLDVICIGRSSVDLYGDQVNGKLEDMSSFSKYVGGSPKTDKDRLTALVILGIRSQHQFP